ncbi:thioredoxin family protein [Kerstersia gyiorum]|uniref:Thioredoxin 1 n=1 Tax=Kerstersia gyiorum TaxID=206506 RepID=A0A4Q7MPU0_9BURK|nr:thioredoxin family protein [Kerstersia gyiorum]MCO7642168.1 thioredoxin family protein [Pseudomonas sp. S 311-6]KAB0544524.1 thioredoxin family protein [Kerstersia gyiorum]MCP1633350.1 thioredoxin 1 [Kerstersia gyiorum]MCP1636222.1 thioredoxin 1 [Kerstersia gyiorum]MCP1671210.1 thioredoxin 1 [Kerstersia gyiorum]
MQAAPSTQDYLPEKLTAQAAAQLPGAVVLDFGTNWCGYCQAARAPVDAALAGFPSIRHIRVEDGKGRPLGRAFGVKLWPTLVLLRDGKEAARLVRPDRQAEIEQLLHAQVP